MRENVRPEAAISSGWALVLPATAAHPAWRR
jgi:hypothetical protein